MNLRPITALGTEWHIEVLDKVSDIDELQIFTEKFIETFEQKYSRFRSDSDLGKLNTDGVFFNPSEEFLDILKQSESAYKSTKGIFNIAVGEKMETSGYDSGYSFTQTKISAVPKLTEVLSSSPKEILVNGGKLDLGGIGKGYLIDLLAKAYQTKYCLKHFIINGGGDIYATSDHGKAIEIALVHPKDQTLSIGRVSLLNQGFAASSPYVRAWKDKKTNVETNHLHTSNKIASYVVADTVCEADIWATTLAIRPDLESVTITGCLLLKDVEVLRKDDIFNLNS
jgi:thiamine biosynthesis lipoprotein